MLKLINIQLTECLERGALLKNIWDCHISVFNKFIKESAYEKDLQSSKFLLKTEEIKCSNEYSLKQLRIKIDELEESLLKKQKEFNNYKLQTAMFEQQESKFQKKNELLTDALLSLRKLYEETLLENIKLKCKNYDLDISEKEFLKMQEKKILENQYKKDQSIFDFLKEIKMFNKFDKKSFSKTDNLNILLNQIVQIDDENTSNIENLDNYEEICKDAYIDTADLFIQKEKDTWTENFFLKDFMKDKEIQTLYYDELISENKNDSENLERENFGILEESKFTDSVIFETVIDTNIETNQKIHKLNSLFSNDQDKFKVGIYEATNIFDYFDEIKEFLIKIKSLFENFLQQTIDPKNSLNALEPEFFICLTKEMEKNLINYETVSKFFKMMNNINNHAQLSLKIENLEHKLDLEESEKIKRQYELYYEEIKDKFSQFFKETIKVDEEFLSNEDISQTDLSPSMNSFALNAIIANSRVSNIKRKGSVINNSMLLAVKNPQKKIFSRKSMVKLTPFERTSIEKKNFQFKSSVKLGDTVVNEFSEINNYPESLANINNDMFEDPSNPENSVTITCNNEISISNFLNNSPLTTTHRKTLSFNPRKSVGMSFVLEKGQQIKSLLSNAEVNLKDIIEKKSEVKNEKIKNNEETNNLINQISDFLTKKRRWSKIQGPNSDKCTNFLIKLHNSNLKYNQSIPLSIILKLISQVYSEILKTYQTKQSNLNPFFFIFYEFTLQKSGGSRERAENKIIRIIQSCQTLTGNYKIKMFMKLLSLGKIENKYLNNEAKISINNQSQEKHLERNDQNNIYDFYDGNDLKLYFDLLAQLDDNPITNTPGMMLAMSSSEKVITSLNKAIEIVRNFSGHFFIKKGQQHKIENVINLMKRMKQKDPMIFRKYVIDVDYVIEKIFEIRNLMNETYKAVFKAADLYKKSGLDSREFLFILKNIERNNFSDHQIIKIFSDEYDFEIEGSNEKCMSFKRFAYLCQSKNILTSKTQENFLEGNFFGLKNLLQLREEIDFRKDLIKIKLIKTKIYDSYYRNMIKNVENNVFLDDLNEKDTSVIWMRFRLLDDESHNVLLDEVKKELLCEHLMIFNDFCSEKYQ